jgi:hypothetical protein
VSQPESLRNFWLGVVGQAVRDLLHPEVEFSTPEERADAYDWLTSDSEAVYSYLWVCDVTDVHPDVARRRLREAGLL